ncbi:nuclear transport factor 2 (NTF2) family protein [Carex rostrata]
MLCSPSIPSSPTVFHFSSSLLSHHLTTQSSQTLACRFTKNTSLSPSPLVTGSPSRVKTSSSEPTTAVSDLSARITSSSHVVRDFYDGINRRDLDSVEGLIAENCVYEDLVFSSPFVGRKAIIEFFKKFTQSISSDLQFVIDDISSEDTSAIGVTWHLEWKGKPFPFSKGCSFYRLEMLDGKKQIIYGRDCVEPATKPGEFALIIIRGVTSLLQQFPWLADQL